MDLLTDNIITTNEKQQYNSFTIWGNIRIFKSAWVIS